MCIDISMIVYDSPCMYDSECMYMGPGKSHQTKQLMGLCGERWNGVLLLYRKQGLVFTLHDVMISMVNLTGSPTHNSIQFHPLLPYLALNMFKWV